MTDLNIKPDEKTPGVELSEGNLLFYGRSIVNDPKSFFDPIGSWVKKYTREPAEVTTVTFRLEYIDAPSARYLMQFLKTIEGIQQKKSLIVKVHWYYAYGDIEMLELGEIIKGRLDLEFDFHEFEANYEE